VIMSTRDNKASFDLPLSPSSEGKKKQPQKTAATTLPNLSLWTLRFDSGILEVMVAPLIYVENLMWGNNLE